MPKWYHGVISPRTKVYQIARNTYLKLLKRNPAAIKQQIDNASGPLRLNIGCGYTFWEGWVNADFPNWDMLSDRDWSYFMGSRKADVIYTEHVLEHLSYRQVEHFVALCARYLKPGGVVRSAVPDEYNPSAEYYHMFKPQPMSRRYEANTEHQTFWSVDSLGQIFRRHGFKLKPVEYFDAEGSFHTSEIDPFYGDVKRSSDNNYMPIHLKSVEEEGDALEWIRLNKHTFKHDYIYSSLVLDAIKQ
jgi:predicted SAM-dependent methyltransferase